jgi:hypothetical protein
VLTATTTDALSGGRGSKALRGGYSERLSGTDWQGSLHSQGLATLDCRRAVPTVPVRLATPHSAEPIPDETRYPTLGGGVAIMAVELRNAKKHVGRRSMSRKRKEGHPAGYRDPSLAYSASLLVCGLAGGLPTA